MRQLTANIRILRRCFLPMHPLISIRLKVQTSGTYVAWCLSPNIANLTIQAPSDSYVNRRHPKSPALHLCSGWSLHVPPHYREPRTIYTAASLTPSRRLCFRRRTIGATCRTPSLPQKRHTKFGAYRLAAVKHDSRNALQCSCLISC